MPKVKLVTTDSDVIKEGEYETQFGKVAIKEVDGGYRIVIYIDGRRLGTQMAQQIAYSLIGPYLAERRTV
jgi:hypothetical protein